MTLWTALLLPCAAAAGAVSHPAFAAYTAEFGKTYKDAAEAARREACFHSNVARIAALNKESPVYGLNKFSDLCPSEFKRYHNMQAPVPPAETMPLVDLATARAAANSSVDWRDKGAVTAVKDQGQCGSCWAFSSTGNMEGQHFLAGNPLIELSEQELVSCAHDMNLGCNGGRMTMAFDWVVHNGGIDSEQDYPYTAGKGDSGKCQDDKTKNVVAKFTGHTGIPHDEDQMAAYILTHGPMSIAVDAANGWQSYTGGIMTNCKAGQLDHGVLIVGFGEEGGTPFWIIKNSWNTDWGEKGYIRVSRGTDACGCCKGPLASPAMIKSANSTIWA